MENYALISLSYTLITSLRQARILVQVMIYRKLHDNTSPVALNDDDIKYT